MSIRVHRKAFLAIKLLAYPRGLSLSRTYPSLWYKLWPLHESALQLCCYNRRRTSCRHGFQFSGIQILLPDYVHRRSGVYNKFSVLKFKSWWRTQAPLLREWEECCFIFLILFYDIFGNFHAASRAHRSCYSVSSWDRSSNFGALGLRLMRITWANHSKRWILVSNVSVT